MAVEGAIVRGCLQSVKDTKFESNSQHTDWAMVEGNRCLQSVKDTKFESNSQPAEQYVTEATKLFAVRQRY